ncbi:hypothetical protein BB560_005668 [Smittium megazygosporum]|uniref:Carbohydrate-binding module family 19 domain-containing protein n=1 Tax=Smittium megazygosporum TaxID=133381 RepID=A0A2T9Z1I3_9FUNG|nr:hypothetical protein BB560_005668 [Smittium megazygosporum]
MLTNKAFFSLLALLLFALNICGTVWANKDNGNDTPKFIDCPRFQPSCVNSASFIHCSQNVDSEELEFSYRSCGEKMKCINVGQRGQCFKAEQMDFDSKNINCTVVKEIGSPNKLQCDMIVAVNRAIVVEVSAADTSDSNDQTEIYETRTTISSQGVLNSPTMAFLIYIVLSFILLY